MKKTYTTKELFELMSDSDIDIETLRLKLLYNENQSKSAFKVTKDMTHEIKITHEMFSPELPSSILSELFKNVKSMSSLTYKIAKLASKNIDEIQRTINHTYTEDKLKGDLFEIFAEIFFKLTVSDNRVGISNYCPEEGEEDNGVDAYGINYYGDKTAIQVKFRSNNIEELKSEDLKNFQGQAYRKYDVDPTKSRNLIVFTNCSGLHWYTNKNVLDNAAETFGTNQSSCDKDLTVLLDNNTKFWNLCYKCIQYNLNL